MGKENTIVTGNVGGKKMTKNIGGSSNFLFFDSKLLKSSVFDYGIVIEDVNDDRILYYTPIKDNISFKKPGQAIPLYPNSQILPKKGHIVPLLTAPDSDNQFNITVYYLDPVGFDGTINDNTVDIETNSDDILNLPTAVRLTEQQALSNAIEVKNYLKDKGLTQEQAAGVIGNMYKENSQFNPIEKTFDSNGVYSLGLIMWNGRSTRDAVGNITENNWSAYGFTVQSQMNALFNPKITPNMQDFLTEIKNEPNKGADYYAYLFAKTVEKCAACTEGYDTFIKGKTIIWTQKDGSLKTVKVEPGNRMGAALDFLKRFNDPNNELAW